jgi:hypothetical protein
MTEKNLVTEIKSHLKKQLPGAVVFKHNDGFTAGVPDISMTYHGITWIEAKLLKTCETASSLKKHFDLLQLATLRLLARQGRAFYAVGYLVEHGPGDKSKQKVKLSILRPDAVNDALCCLNCTTDDVGQLLQRAVFDGLLPDVIERFARHIKEGRA